MALNPYRPPGSRSDSKIVQRADQNTDQKTSQHQVLIKIALSIFIASSLLLGMLAVAIGCAGIFPF